MKRKLIDRTLKSAMFYGALGTMVRLGSSILLLPLVLRHFSDAELAVWWVFVAFGDFAVLSDLGFAPAISRVYSYLWAGAKDFQTEGLQKFPQNQPPNISGVATLHATVSRLYLILSLGLFLILSTAGTAYMSLTSINDTPDPAESWLAWWLYIGTICLSLRLSHWIFAATGVNKVRDVQSSALLGGIAYLLAGSLFILLDFGLLAMVAAVGARAFVSRQLCKRSFFKRIPSESCKNAKPSREMLRKLWPNARKFGIMTLGGFLINRGLIFIGTPALPAATMAALGLSQQIGMFSVSFSSLWLKVKWPEINILRAQGKLERLSELFSKRLALSLVTYLLFATTALTLGDPLLELLNTGKTFLPNAAFSFYLLYLGLQMFYVMFGQLALTENVVPFFRLSIATGCISFLLSLILLHFMGLWGLLLAPFIAEATCSGWLVVRRGFRGQSLSISEFIRSAFSLKF